MPNEGFKVSKLTPPAPRGRDGAVPSVQCTLNASEVRGDTAPGT